MVTPTRKMLHSKKFDFMTLDKMNYVAWKAQVSAILSDSDLLQFVEGEIEINDNMMLIQQD